MLKAKVGHACPMLTIGPRAAIQPPKEKESYELAGHACFKRFVPIIRKFGGTVDKFIGDAVMGDAVNLAARLEGLSERREILVGPDTWRLSSALFDFDEPRPVSVKGKSEPVSWPT